MDYESYPSAEELTTASEAAITGTVLGVKTKECDKGGDPAGVPTIDPTDAWTADPNPDPSVQPTTAAETPPPGVEGDAPSGADCQPMVFLRVRVSGMIKRSAGLNEGDEIVVGNIDTSKTDMEGVTELVTGQQYALYLEQLSPGEHPGITTVPTFWIPKGGNQGIFIIRKGEVTPASSSVVALTAAEAQGQDGPQTTERAAGSDGFPTTIAELKRAADLAEAHSRK
ncbi:hypothetical protein [Streptomyces sp. NRRL S-87]|uniref:hypothetical protein n=1 Tax=Streptomyces sp. NRRL S-87 TaxID=1463920 RepID=UPI00131DFEFC|nr:hypothetical protein [Streptomyces sp. NRRL S-87]